MRSFNGISQDFEMAPLDADKLNWYPQTSLPPEIPIIDLDKVETEEDLAQFLADIRKSGLFYVTNHGVPEDVPIECYNLFRELCNQPEQVREKYNTDPCFFNGGYVPFKGTSIGGGNIKNKQRDFVVKYFWRGPSVVNRSPSDKFKYWHDKFHTSTAAVANKVIETILRSLKTRFPDFDPEELMGNVNSDNMFFSNRIYPDIPPVEGEVVDYRLVPHRDLSFITIAHQIPAPNGYKGLFVVMEDGKKVHVPPIRNCYLVFLGQSLAYLTNKYLPAGLHGVDFPDTNKFEGSERSSLIAFYQPNDPMIPSKAIKPKKDEIMESSCSFYDSIGLSEEETTYVHVREKFNSGYYL